MLIVKKSGTWTKRLFDMAQTGGYTEAGIGRDVTVMIEGPYGSQPAFFLPVSFYLNKQNKPRWSRPYPVHQLLRCRLSRGREWDHICALRRTRPHPTRPQRPELRQDDRSHLDGARPRLGPAFDPSFRIHDRAKRVHSRTRVDTLHTCGERDYEAAAVDDAAPGADADGGTAASAEGAGCGDWAGDEFGEWGEGFAED